MNSRTNRIKLNVTMPAFLILEALSRIPAIPGLRKLHCNLDETGTFYLSQVDEHSAKPTRLEVLVVNENPDLNDFKINVDFIDIDDDSFNLIKTQFTDTIETVIVSASTVVRPSYSGGWGNKELAVYQHRVVAICLVDGHRVKIRDINTDICTYVDETELRLYTGAVQSNEVPKSCRVTKSEIAEFRNGFFNRDSILKHNIITDPRVIQILQEKDNG